MPSAFDVLLVTLVGIAYGSSTVYSVRSFESFSETLSASKGRKEDGVRGYVVKTAAGDFAFSQVQAEGLPFSRFWENIIRVRAFGWGWVKSTVGRETQSGYWVSAQTHRRLERDSLGSARNYIHLLLFTGMTAHLCSTT
jgi:hypothetical protein